MVPGRNGIAPSMETHALPLRSSLPGTVAEYGPYHYASVADRLAAFTSALASAGVRYSARRFDGRVQVLVFGAPRAEHPEWGCSSLHFSIAADGWHMAPPPTAMAFLDAETIQATMGACKAAMVPRGDWYSMLWSALSRDMGNGPASAWMSSHHPQA